MFINQSGHLNVTSPYVFDKQFNCGIEYLLPFPGMDICCLATCGFSNWIHLYFLN